MWADEARLNEIKRKIEFENLFIVERNNRGGVSHSFGEIQSTCMLILSHQII